MLEKLSVSVTLAVGFGRAIVPPKKILTDRTYAFEFTMAKFRFKRLFLVKFIYADFFSGTGCVNSVCEILVRDF